MILLTGAAGFVGSYTLGKLNAYRVRDILICDKFDVEKKQNNLAGKSFIAKIDRDILFKELPAYKGKIDCIIHLGARTDTTEFNKVIFDKLNLEFSKDLWNYSAENDIPFIYASSAATYGNGEMGYDDSTPPGLLHPLNPYGESKNEFDKWALAQIQSPSFWCGMKFFNVYGPNEYHKGRMASVIFHAFNQIVTKGEVTLFKSHHPDYADGHQSRDFIYVDDIAEFIWFIYKRQTQKGLINLGTGQARTFLDLTKAVFDAMGKTPKINFIDTPEDIRDKYQYFTQAVTTKLINTQFNRPITSLEEGVKKYMQNFLIPKKYY
jgi:ADP-L-glycero-D-manno-heptose 6-epimerase